MQNSLKMQSFQFLLIKKSKNDRSEYAEFYLTRGPYSNSGSFTWKTIFSILKRFYFHSI